MSKHTLLRPALRSLLAVATMTGGALLVPAAGTATAAITTVSAATPAAAPTVDTQALELQRSAARRAARAERRRIARQRHRQHVREMRKRHRQHLRAVRKRHEARLRHEQRMRGAKELRAYDVARDQTGDPYVWGATGPNAFDCSGLTSYAFHRAGLSLPRTAAAQSAAVRHIPHSQMRKGDLVFFSSGGHVYHVGIFVGRRGGEDLMLHAPRPGESVRTEPIWTSSWSGGTLR
jgi:cell wall-associated NlpC family hydrolase